MSRYEIIAGMLEDPLSLACALREILRLEKKGVTKLLPPPIINPSKERYIYPTFREFLRIKKVSNAKNFESLDYVVEIFTTGDSIWYIATQDGTEIGPFDSFQKAEFNMKELYKEEGYSFLDKSPWSDEDASKFPL